MALTSLLWISISLWPVRKREDESEGVAGSEKEGAREREREGKGEASSLGLPLDLGAAAGPKDVKQEKKARKMRNSGRKRQGTWNCQFLERKGAEGR